MIAFIDDHREEHGIEPIRRVLPLRPSACHDPLVRRAEPSRRSARAGRDDALRPEILRVFDENFGGCGVRKVWRRLRREGFDVARLTVARRMKDRGLKGVIRGKPIRTTVPDTSARRPLRHLPVRRARNVFAGMLGLINGLRRPPERPACK